MPAMLQHIKTGRMYIYTKQLAARSDMREVDVPDIAPNKELPKPAKKATVKKPEIKVESDISLDNLFK
jgi:hypothetical protein